MEHNLHFSFAEAFANEVGERTMLKSTRWITVAALVGAVAAAHGQAYILGANLDFRGLVSGKNGDIDYSTNGGSNWVNNQGLGFMQWGILNNAALPLSGLGGRGAAADGLGSGIDLYTVCSELQALSDPQLVDVWNSNDVLLGAAINRAGSVTGANFGGITAFQHAWQGSNMADRAVGIQIAVWAARYGSGLAMSINGSDQIEAGSFRVRYSNTGNWSNIKTYAQLYYGAAYAAWNVGAGYNNSVFLKGANTGGLHDQDQLTWDFSNPPQSVPEPFTMALGAAGALAYVRRRMKRPASVA